jgi:hypothetical protein
LSGNEYVADITIPTQVIGKPFSDYELICEIQVKNGPDLGENY